jgi:hypothetical protein
MFNKMRTLVAVFAFLLAVCLIGGSVWAASDSKVNTVTIRVDGRLSIAENTGDFTLTFDDFVTGSQSDSTQVTYRVKGNNMAGAALDGVLSAQISSLIDGVDLEGDVGTIFHRPGSVQLLEQASGYSTVETTLTGLVKKDASSSRILSARIPVTWRASATKDLTSGEYNTSLTVTVKDA